MVTIKAADALAESVRKMAVLSCPLCSEYDGLGGYKKIYENIPTIGSDGKFYHHRHDKLDGGEWLCDVQEIHAALTQYKAAKDVKP